jgi:hypothetical protein
MGELKLNQLMKSVRAEAFTLIELLAIIAVLAVIAAMVVPRLQAEPRGKYGLSCMNNQKQIEMGLAMWAEDNDHQFPWNVSTKDGGTKELIADGQAATQFQVLSNLVQNPSAFVCPKDKLKLTAAKTSMLSNSNISYFVNVDASMETNSANVILTGDRHLEVASNPVRPGLFVYTNGMAMSWTDELHHQSNFSRLGVIAFCDCHVESVLVHKTELTDVFNRQKLASERLLVP